MRTLERTRKRRPRGVRRREAQRNRIWNAVDDISGRPMHYIETKDGGVRPASLRQWARMFESPRRIVARTRVGGILISTVFLGLDHRWTFEGPPILYETMAFGAPDDDADEYQTRYATRAEARHGHALAVELARIHTDKAIDSVIGRQMDE